MKLRNHLLLGFLVGLTLAAGLGLSHLARASEPLKPMHVNQTKPLEFQTSNVNFQAVDMVSGNDGWAVGGNLIYHYNGSTWQLAKALNNAWLYDIKMVSATEGWAIGKRPGLASGSDTGIWRYSGGDWQLVTAPAAEPLRALELLSSSDGWAVGNGGLIMRYNGSSWQIDSYPVWSSGRISDVDMVSPTDGWAIGDNGGILHYNGVSWSYFGDITGSWSKRAISMIAANDGWIVGNGGLAHYNGTSWQEVTSPTAEELWAVEMISTGDGWAVGDNGTILHYNGANWQTVSSPTGEHLYGISLVSAADGWAVGDNGTLLHYNGSSWQRYNEAATQLLRNPSFESGSNPYPWQWLDTTCNYRVYDGTSAYSGSRYLATNRNNSSNCSSFYQDVNRTLVVGETYTFGIWVRTPDSGITRTGEVVIWTSGGNQEKSSTLFTVSGGDSSRDWQYVQTSLTIAHSGHTGLRTEVYLQSPLDTVDYYFDNAALWGGARYPISGRVTHSNGKPVSGATVSAGGRTATTKGDGSYYIGGLTNGQYTVTLNKDGYTFTPPSRTVNVLNGNATGQNFEGSIPCASLTTNSSPGGFIVASPLPDCPVDGSKYKANTIIDLIASPKPDYRFVKWTGDVSSTNQIIDITLGTQNKTVAATFEVISPPSYNRPPILFVHGWQGIPNHWDYWNHCDDLLDKESSYFGVLDDYLAGDQKYRVFYAKLNTSACYTPGLRSNAIQLRHRINEIKTKTGEDRIILIAHSMGGVVSRYYIESDLYQDDVEQLFTLGSPHLGLPVNDVENYVRLSISTISHAIVGLPGLLVTKGYIDSYRDGQEIFDDLSDEGIKDINRMLSKKEDVEYYFMSGNAPSESRNELGKLLGWLIGGERVGDDGFIRTASAINHPKGNNNIHSLPPTNEVHADVLGPSHYFSDEGIVNRIKQIPPVPYQSYTP